MTDVFRHVVVLKLDPDAVSTGHHSDNQEQQQGRHSELGPDLGEDDREKNEHRDQQEKVLGKDVD